MTCYRLGLVGIGGPAVSSDFFERIDELIEAVGSGHLVGGVEVDQVYSHRQHDETTWKHPRGGEWGYLTKPFFENLDNYMHRLADLAIVPEGSNLRKAMTDNVEHLSKQVSVRAPIEFDNLRQSGHPTVTDDGEIVYDRPPEQPRLSPEQLKAIRKKHRNLA